MDFRLLVIDLSTGKSETRLVDPKYTRQFIGGGGGGGGARRASAVGGPCPRPRSARPGQPAAVDDRPAHGDERPHDRTVLDLRPIAPDRAVGGGESRRLRRAGVALCRLRWRPHHWPRAETRVSLDPQRPGRDSRRGAFVGRGRYEGNAAPYQGRGGGNRSG